MTQNFTEADWQQDADDFKIDITIDHSEDKPIVQTYMIKDGSTHQVIGGVEIIENAVRITSGRPYNGFVVIK
ncbi:neuroglobin [Chryseobacterium sp. StRB126]|uniref:hypothetical protein n=1 Tax=Chryseobacterium sp. StRB126 TaxID=878220 RepID=UPI0004E998B8|nr:hypothetical protein [Chryseobacterium sp. StRB126]BAP30156.1 neuroglobin [Chryseobacterium sp. StRB126]